MTDIQEETQNKIRRSLGIEFSRMEDDFDETRDLRKKITHKLVEAASNVILLDDKGNTREDTVTAMSVMTGALKALAETEKANVQAITMKLRHSEQETANATMNKDRIMVVLKATEPGRIVTTSSPEDRAAKLSEMFDTEIKDFELKNSPNDLDM